LTGIIINEVLYLYGIELIGVESVVIDLRQRLLKFIVLFTVTVLIVTGGSKLVDIFWHWYYPLEYREAIYQNANNFAIDPLLIAAIIRVESKFDANAQSARGARGLMQIMPETGAWVAAKIGIENYNDVMLLDPEINIKIGTWYLANLSQEFDHDLIIVLAAYNGGRGNVRKWLEKEDWDGRHETIKDIPFPETKEYIWRVLRDYERYKKIYADG